MSFKVDNFSEYLIKAKNGFKTNAQDNSNAPKSPHLKSHLTNLKQSSKDTFTNTASQNAKQDIEKALDAKSIDEVKNILFSKNPEFTKKKLALCAGLLIAYVGIAAIRKPHALKEIVFNFIASAKMKKNQIHFNEEKIFDGPIDLNKMYEKAKEKVKNVTLNLAFDEKTITDDKLTETLRSFGAVEFEIQREKDRLKNNPALMHLFNIMAGFTSPKNKKMFSYFEYSHMNNTMATPDEIETYFKVIKKGLSQDQNLFIPILHNGKFREAVEITGLYREILKRCKIPKGFSETCITLTESLNKENQEKFLNFIASLKKGTVLNNPWSLRDLFSYSQDADYLKMQRIYENLKSNIVNKIDLQELENFANCEFKKSTELVKILNEAPEEVIDKLRGWELLTYVNFNEFYGAKNINQLSMQQKKLLLRRLISSNSDTFSNGKKIAPVLPSNQKEYCTLLDRLAKSIGVDTKPLTKDELMAFKKGIDNIKDYIQGIDFNNVTIDMAFTRADFVKQTQEVLSKLSEAQKAEVMDYFGFEIQNGILKGYPINVNNGEKMKEISSHAAKKAIEKLRPIVQKFSTNNQIQIKGASKEFNDCLNQILKGLPELRTIIGRAQHETHAFTLDIHTFKVLQNVCTNPKFKNLSAEDKKVLEIASLLHDITKTEGLRDAMHPIESAFDAYYIIQKLNLPENQQLKIYELIRTHNWLQQLNNPKNKDIVENIAQDIAFDTRFSNIFDMAKILCEADLKSVKKDASFFKNYEAVLEQMSAKVDGYVQSLHNSQIFLPQTRIPKASEIKNGIIKSADGIQNTVIYMDKLDDDLSKYGFDEGTTKSNWTALVHALEYDQQMSKFNTFSIVDNEALLSTSFINPKEYKVFRNQGLILNVNTSDIHAGYERDFGTGYSKSIELLKQDYLFHGKRKNVDQLDGWRKHNGSEYRNFIPQKIQQKAGLTPEEYYQKLSQIQDCTSITDIEKVDKDFAEVLLDVFNDMHKGKRRGGRNYNEILVSRPKIQGVFAYDEDYEKIPAFLRKFAQDNNLPIIIFGK